MRLRIWPRAAFIGTAALALTASVTWAQQPDFVAPEIPLKVSDGEIIVREARFIKLEFFRDYVPEISFVLVNRTKGPVGPLHIRFDIDAICNGAERKLSGVVSVSIGHSSYLQETTQPVSRVFEPLVNNVNGCRATGIHAEVAPETKAQRDADAAEASRRAAEIDQRHAEGLKQNDETQRAAVEIAVAKAREAARIRAEERVAKEVCPGVYKETADKKVADLTVKEEQQVRACQVIGMYHQ